MKTYIPTRHRVLTYSLLLALLLFTPNLLSAQIDLELNMTGTPLVPGAFKNFTFNLVATNQGTTTASNVEIDIPLPDGFIYQGGNEYVASQGTYDIYTERKWILGSLAPGATATMQMNLYSLQSVMLYLYAEVSNADQNDIDSSPGNGGCTSSDPTTCATNEDDEALFIISNSGTCAINATVLSTACINPNDSPNPLDDEWSLTIQVNATNALSNGWITNSQGYNGLTGNYGEAVTIGNFFISAGPLEFTLFDQNNNNCFTTFTVNPPSPCSNNNCTLVATTSPSICSDSGTPNDPTDDGFQFFLYVNPTNPSSTQYQVVMSNAATPDIVNVAYTEDLLISKFIADGPLTLDIRDLADAGCTTSLILNPPAPCSGNPPGTGVDLDLNFSTANSNPSIYSANKFTLNLSNTGSETATGIRVEIPDVPELAYVSHNTINGVFNSWLGFWEVGNLNAGATATLEIDLFTLSDAPLNLYAQVYAQNETDSDSSPNNGTCTSTNCVANEDDETVLVLNGGTPPTSCSLNATIADLLCNDNGTTDPGDDTYTISINPTGSNLGNSFKISGGGLSFSGIPYGQNYTSPALPLSSGNFLLTITDESDDCSTDISIVPPPPCSISNPTGTDLELAISASQSTVSEWESFSMTITLSNSGTAAANNIVVNFPLPDGVVFNGSDSYTASQGTFSTYFEEWEVGTLVAGGTAMIQLNMFSRQETNPVVGYAQVMSMDEADVDSSPGNGTCCTAVEDDEVAITLLPLPSSPSTKLSAKQQGARPNIHKLYPNPAIEVLNIILESPEKRQGWIEIYNVQGRIQQRQETNFQQGTNFLQVEINHLPAGVYFLHLPGKNQMLGLNKFFIQK